MQINDAQLVFFRSLRKRSRTTEIVLHHAGSNGTVEAVHSYHRDVKGWAGIAYHYFVRKDGSVWRGRPEDTVGGHSGAAHNEVSVGICAEGNFEIDEMPRKQQTSLILLLAEVWGRYPDAVVLRHSDIGSTACPGKNYPFGEIVKGAEEVIELAKFIDCIGHWAETEIDRCTEIGLLKGREDGFFDPDADITRAETAAVLSRLLDLLKDKGIQL